MDQVLAIARHHERTVEDRPNRDSNSGRSERIRNQASFESALHAALEQAKHFLANLRAAIECPDFRCTPKSLSDLVVRSRLAEQNRIGRFLQILDVDLRQGANLVERLEGPRKRRAITVSEF